MSLNRDTVSSEQLGHLGLVAATIRELGIIDKIDTFQWGQTRLIFFYESISISIESDPINS